MGNHDILEHLWRLKTNMDSGMFDALQRTAAFILNGPWDFVHEMCEVYRRRRDLLAEALTSVGHAGAQAQGHHLHVDPGARRATPRRASASTCSSRRRWWSRPGSGYGPAGEGFVRLSLTTPDDRIAEAVDRIERSLRL